MARINIEDDIWRDERFFRLATLLGCRGNAIGALVLFWLKSQENFLMNGGWINQDQWRNAGLNDKIKDFGFCEIDADGRVRPTNADKHFGWLFSKSKNGRAGGIASGKKKRCGVEIIKKSVKRTEPNESDSKPLTPTPTPTPTLAPTQEKELNNAKALFSSVVENSTPKANAPEFENQGIDEILGEVGIRAQKAWLAAYPDASWIVQEIKKSLAWCEVNPRRRPKKYARFIGGWLSRGWEMRRKTMPTLDQEKKLAQDIEWARWEEEQRKKTKNGGEK